MYKKILITLTIFTLIFSSFVLPIFPTVNASTSTKSIKAVISAINTTDTNIVAFQTYFDQMIKPNLKGIEFINSTIIPYNDAISYAYDNDAILIVIENGPRKLDNTTLIYPNTIVFYYPSSYYQYNDATNFWGGDNYVQGTIESIYDITATIPFISPSLNYLIPDLLSYEVLATITINSPYAEPMIFAYRDNTTTYIPAPVFDLNASGFGPSSSVYKAVKTYYQNISPLIYAIGQSKGYKEDTVGETTVSYKLQNGKDVAVDMSNFSVHTISKNLQFYWEIKEIAPLYPYGYENFFIVDTGKFTTMDVNKSPSSPYKYYIIYLHVTDTSSGEKFRIPVDGNHPSKILLSEILYNNDIHNVIDFYNNDPEYQEVFPVIKLQSKKIMQSTEDYPYVANITPDYILLSSMGSGYDEGNVQFKVIFNNGDVNLYETDHKGIIFFVNFWEEESDFYQRFIQEGYIPFSIKSLEQIRYGDPIRYYDDNGEHTIQVHEFIEDYARKHNIDIEQVPLDVIGSYVYQYIQQNLPFDYSFYPVHVVINNDFINIGGEPNALLLGPSNINVSSYEFFKGYSEAWGTKITNVIVWGINSDDLADLGMFKNISHMYTGFVSNIFQLAGNIDIYPYITSLTNLQNLSFLIDDYYADVPFVYPVIFFNDNINQNDKFLHFANSFSLRQGVKIDELQKAIDNFIALNYHNYGGEINIIDVVPMSYKILNKYLKESNVPPSITHIPLYPIYKYKPHVKLLIKSHTNYYKESIYYQNTKLGEIQEKLLNSPSFDIKVETQGEQCKNNIFTSTVYLTFTIPSDIIKQYSWKLNVADIDIYPINSNGDKIIFQIKPNKQYEDTIVPVKLIYIDNDKEIVAWKTTMGFDMMDNPEKEVIINFNPPFEGLTATGGVVHINLNIRSTELCRVNLDTTITLYGTDNTGEQVVSRIPFSYHTVGVNNITINIPIFEYYLKSFYLKIGNSTSPTYKISKIIRLSGGSKWIVIR